MECFSDRFKTGLTDIALEDLNGFLAKNMNFNPHPSVPAPTLVGGDSNGKTGDRLGLQPRLPLFFRQINLYEFTESTIKVGGEESRKMKALRD